MRRLQHDCPYDCWAADEVAGLCVEDALLRLLLVSGPEAAEPAGCHTLEREPLPHAPCREEDKRAVQQPSGHPGFCFTVPHPVPSAQSVLHHTASP